VDAYPNQVFKGRVTQVRNAPITVQNVVTYNVVIGADNTDLLLRPGMTANVSIIVSSRENVLRIASQALRFKPSLVKADDKAGSSQVSAADKRGGGGKGGLPGGGGQDAKAKSTVWLPNPSGEPTAVGVKTGITDGTYTELIEGPLKEEDEVIIGLDKPRGSHGGSSGSLPPGFGSQQSERKSKGLPKGM
jgi:HlyD family secretion protein